MTNKRTKTNKMTSRSPVKDQGRARAGWPDFKQNYFYIWKLFKSNRFENCSNQTDLKTFQIKWKIFIANYRLMQLWGKLKTRYFRRHIRVASERRQSDKKNKLNHIPPSDDVMTLVNESPKEFCFWPSEDLPLDLVYEL